MNQLLHYLLKIVQVLSRAFSSLLALALSSLLAYVLRNESGCHCTCFGSLALNVGSLAPLTVISKSWTDQVTTICTRAPHGTSASPIGSVALPSASLCKGRTSGSILRLFLVFSVSSGLGKGCSLSELSYKTRETFFRTRRLL